MKSKIISTLKSLGQRVGLIEKPVPKPLTTPVIITSYSQPHVLQQRMMENNMTHGQTNMADISPVRLENACGKMVMYFCPVQQIDLHEELQKGDGGRIPIQAIVEKLAVSEDLKPGLYKLKDIMLTSNGTIQVHATEKTQWELV